MKILSHRLADIGSVSNDETSMRLKVNVDNSAEKINPEESFESLVYKGTRGLLQQEINMKGVYECFYDLFGFTHGQYQQTTACFSANSSN